MQEESFPACLLIYSDRYWCQKKKEEKILMTHQEEVSILCEVLFGCFTSVVVYIASDSRTSTASAFMMDAYMVWAAVLNASSLILCRGF